ncbi:MAG: hypothetical protein IJC37_00235 [Clostridia bacterium]|nr:hypothetical protein [Clostridia bacterium]
MKRWIALSLVLIITLKSFDFTASAVVIDAVYTLKEGWSDAYSDLLVDSVSESGNKINYARAFAMNEGDFLYLKLDAKDGPAPDGVSPEGIEITTDGALFACFIDESVSSDYDRNLYSFDCAVKRSIEGFTVEMCIIYKSGLPDTVSLTFVLTDSVGEKSARLPFSYTIPEETNTSAAETTSVTEQTSKTTKAESSTKRTITSARTATEIHKSEARTEITETSVATTKATAHSTDSTVKKAVAKAAESTARISETKPEISTEKKLSTAVSSTVTTINAGALLNLEIAKEAKKKKQLATAGCVLVILTACFAGTVNFKKNKKNDIDE